jgi:gliding motility-associated-like protein
MKLYSTFIILFLFNMTGFAQNHEWAETLEGSTASVYGIDIDEADNIYMAGTYRDSLVAKDYILKPIRPTLNGTGSFVCKTNKNGDVKWMRSIEGGSLMRIMSIKVVTNNKIVVYGTTLINNFILYFSNIDSIIPPQSLRTHPALILATYDSSGNLLNYQLVNKQRGFTIGLWAAGTNSTGFVESDTQGNIYISFNYRISGNTTFIYSSSDSMQLSLPNNFNTSQNFIAKYNSNFDSIIWIKEIANTASSTLSITKLKMGRDNNLYIASNFTPGPSNRNLVFEDTTYNLPDSTLSKGIAVVMNASGDIIYKGYINQNMRSDYISSIDAVDTSTIFVVGAAKDTIMRNGIHFFANNPLPPNTTPTGASETMFPFVAKLGSRNIDWVKMSSRPLVSRFSNSTPYGFRGGIDKDNNFYVNIQIASPSTIGGLTSDSSVNGGFIKFDTLGNALWLLTGRINVEDMKPNSENKLIYGGRYVEPAVLSPFTLLGRGGYIAKITDYSITRGEVFAGPYCAGDSILIPYTRMGPFEPDNEFIAELSDENGNFEGGQRELGRLKTTEDSTIIGALPLFEVSSSANYRIRIRSTHPPVQSFFRLDSLRLLIYSRDKADPGPPETVCFGDSFRLNTFGGTAWEWSPNYRMNNPNARNPLIYPDRDTLFRIVISDSSGCGEPDTAFKQIFIRPKAQIQTQTLVNACWGLPVNLTANFTEGDSSQYRWTWFSTQNFQNWVPLQSDSFRSNDTFTFNYPQSNTNRRFALVLEDDCQTIKDTSLITVRLSPHRISSILSTQDSVICYQSQQNLIANISGGDSLTYQWQWFEVDAMGEFNFLKEDSIRFSDTLQVQLRPESKDFQRYALVSNDNCIPFFDTAYLNVNINPHQPQTGILPTDTAICPSTEVELVGQVNNGSALGYAFIWLDETNTILQSDTGFIPQIFSPTPDFSGGQSERIYRLVAQDLCSPNADTAQTRIIPLEPLQAIPITLDTTVCSGQELSLSANGLGGVSSNYQYQWILNNNIISSDSDVGFIPPINPSPFTIQLVLTDNCMPQNDTADITVRVKPALQSVILREPHQDHAVQDTTVCSGSELRFFAKALGGDSTNYSYEWLWNDSLMGTQKELLFVPIHPSPSTLHLISKDGCTVPNDTTSVTINILPPLNVSASLSGAGALPDTLCSGEETQLFAQAFGGDSTNYSFEWLLNDSLIATGSDVVVRLSNHHPSPSTLQLVLSDGCSSPNDTFVHTFIIRPALAIDLSASTLCANPTTTLTANPSGGNPDNYVIQWFDEAENMLGEGLSIEVTPTQLTTYKAILTDGCSADSASTQIQIDLIPSILELTASPTEGCEPLEMEFEINTNYQDSFSGILFISDTDSIELSNLFGRIGRMAIRPSGIYNPSFQFISKLGCTGVSQNTPTITVHPKPTAAFSFSPEEPDLDNNSVQFRNLSTGANSYVWSISPFGNFTEAEPNVIYTDSGFHPLQLIAISDQDCRDTVQGQVYIRTNYRVYIPNVFSPNGDGKNDLFRPAMRGFAESDLNIYNRWGERLFQSRDNTGWDGTYRGQPVPEGVYMYTLSVLNLYGEKQFFNGTVVLMR